MREKIDSIKNKIRNIKLKKVKLKMYNYTLKIITGVSVIALITSLYHIDIASLVPCIIALVSLSWIIVFIFANKDSISL